MPRVRVNHHVIVYQYQSYTQHTCRCIVHQRIIHIQLHIYRVSPPITRAGYVVVTNHLYLVVRLHKMTELDPKGNYLFGYHPHGKGRCVQVDCVCV